MADSLVRLRIDSQEYDQKLKRAAEGLTRYADECRKIGGTLEVVEKETLDYVRAVGQMDTVSRTATGKLAEMKKTFVELSVQYQQMTEAEKQAPYGKATAQSLDELKNRINESKAQLEEANKLLTGGGANAGGGGLFSSDKLSGMLQVFGGNLMTKAAGMATGFVSEIGDAVKQSAELARQGEGIRNAFERLNQPGLLDNLREATHGTVTNLELMKAAVKFNDFKLPVEELGTMLAFAQQKAKDTGQSIDYLVESIVTGLGRKSLMILDNLGLSATEIKEKMAETGDMTKAVGAIIREQMSKAGDYVETAADRATRADVDLKNSMEDLGRTLMPLTDAGQGLFNSWKVAALDLLNSAIKPLLQAFTQLGAIQKIQENVNGGGFMERITNNLRSANNKDFVYSQQLMEINKAINKARGNLQQAENGGMGGIEIYRNRLKALEGIRDQYIAAAKQIMSPPAESAVGAATATPKGGGSSKASPTYAADSIAAQSALVSELTKKFNESGEAVRNSLLPQLVLAEQKLKTMRDEAALLKANAEGKLLGGNVDTTGLSRAGVTGTDLRTPTLVQGISSDALESAKAWQKAGNDSAEAWKNAASAVSMVGNALSGIEDPAARVMGTIAQAIANITLAYAEALAKDKTNKSNIWYFIGTAAVMMASMVSTISQIHQATGYAEGGLVRGGGRYSGDNIPIMANEGELVLTKAMQGNLASQLNNNGGFTGNFDALVSGENIHIVHNRYLKRSGQGEIVTWKE